MFEGLVTNVELMENTWDDKAVDESQCVDLNMGCFQTSTRTIIGNVTKADDGVYTVDIGQKNPLIIVAKDFPSLGYELFLGDVLNLNCTVQEDPDSWNGRIESHGKVLAVLSFRPSGTEHDMGTVTSYCKSDKCYIINEKIVASEVVVKSEFPDGLDFCENYEYEAIETSVMVNGKNFNWRLTNIRNTTHDTHPDIKMFGVTVNATMRSTAKQLKKFVKIHNNSKKSVTIQSCELTQFSGGIAQLQTSNQDAVIKPSKVWNVYIEVNPTRVGSFTEHLEVDFGEFKKKTYVQIEISMDRPAADVQGCERGELIPGQRLRRAPRFVEIRIDSHAIPAAFRKFDFKKELQLTLADMQDDGDYLFLFDPLSEDNYMHKMQYSLFMEELEMEIHFERYRIDRGYFEQSHDGLYKLEVLDVGEKRPSIGFGDSIHVKEASDDAAYVFEGCIQKVEQHHIYVAFNTAFRPEFCRRVFQIEFHFSRSQFRRQHHALKTVLADSGLGLNFLFPTNVVSKNPQVDVELVDGVMMRGSKRLEWNNKSLNVYQKQAVVNVLRGENRPLPYIIYGPPGELTLSLLVIIN